VLWKASKNVCSAHCFPGAIDMQPCAPLQIQFNLSAPAVERFGFSPAACTSIISYFLEAAETEYAFSRGTNLHRLYEKVLAVACARDTPHAAVRQLCSAARQGGYFTKVIAAPELFEELLAQQGALNVSEAWLKEPRDRDALERTWTALVAVASSVVLVDDPSAAATYPFLDRETISGSTFRIISPSALSGGWPLEFVVDECGMFSRPINRAAGSQPVLSLANLLEDRIDAQQQVPGDVPVAASRRQGRA
jgi:hypothetical protein